MANKLKLRDATVRCLSSQPGERFTARQIAEWVASAYPAECAEKISSSAQLKNQSDLLQQLVAEISSNRTTVSRRHPNVRTTESRPRLYYWATQTQEAEVSAIEPVRSNLPDTPTRELELYPKLAEFLRADSDLHVQRIDEKRSPNRRGPQGNRWLFPDLVALEDLTKDWSREVRDCVSEAKARKARLWSFEVKLLVNRSNVRECFFQTVSNSSWANFAYLVAGEIGGDGTLKELRMLSALHGVGVMRLDQSNPAESEVLIPARERLEIDWANCDRLASENSDFLDVVKRLWEFHRTGQPKSAEWIA